MIVVTEKLVTIFLGLALTAFTVSTIVLAVQKTNLHDQLQESKNKLQILEDALKSTTTTTTTTVNTPISTTATGSTPTAEPQPKPDEKIDYRLPATMHPLNYDLYLHPDVETGKFTGQELITINCTENTNRIILHSLNLNITSVYLLSSADVSIQNHQLDNVREFLVIELDKEIIAPALISLGIVFEGSMKNKIIGLYSSSYLKADSTRKWIASSKFEPTYARQAFPCFDEPALKATFTVTLVYPNSDGYHALSNMNMETITRHGNFNEANFSQSVPMSTYLSCFIISDFEYKNTSVDTKGIGNEFELRVFATPEQLNKVDFALDVGKKVIEYYIQYFKIAYPLPKLDMAAIPDFVSGAMEHWGLVTYRETSLLYDKAVSSTANTQRVAKVIAHEFAHMWFGNLVTMSWWNDLWLNEGFASYIENKGIEAAFSDWGMQDQFLISTLHGVLGLDATLGAHPIVQTVENPDQITEIFDTITYSKGASIIRMLEDFLDADNFQQAVSNYLDEFKFRTAVTDDFLTVINKLNLDFDVKAIMRTWTEQMGLPVVEITKVSNSQYKLTQKRFFSNPSDYELVYNDSPFNYTWSIPITYTTSATSEVQRTWFYFYNKEIIINLPADVEWIKFNKDQFGYYRVNYDTEMWERLADKLLTEPWTFSVADRASLLNDAFALADSTQLPYNRSLDMTRYLSKEDQYVPWSVAASKLASLKHTLMFTDAFVDYNNYTRDLVTDIYKTVGWTVGEDHMKNLLRVTILSTACSLGLPACLNEASNQFSKWLKNPSVRPHPDIRGIVYYYGMFTLGDEKVWNQVWELYKSETDASEKSKLMYGLSAIQQPWILSRYVDLAWDEQNVRGQDYFTCLQDISSNPIGQSIVWDYVREHWPQLVERFTINERYLGNLIPGITGRFATRTKLQEMQDFFDKYPNAGAGTAARVRALENVKNNIAWLENNLSVVREWLRNRST